MPNLCRQSTLQPVPKIEIQRCPDIASTEYSHKPVLLITQPTVDQTRRHLTEFFSIHDALYSLVQECVVSLRETGGLRGNTSIASLDHIRLSEYINNFFELQILEYLEEFQVYIPRDKQWIKSRLLVFRAVEPRVAAPIARQGTLKAKPG